jgi:hypothetical protein
VTNIGRDRALQGPFIGSERIAQAVIVRKLEDDDGGTGDGRRGLYRQPHGARALGFRRAGGGSRQSVNRLPLGRSAGGHPRCRRCGRSGPRLQDPGGAWHRQHPLFRRQDRGAGIRHGSAGLLLQQHRENPGADRDGGREGHQKLRLFLDGDSLRQCRGAPARGG